MKWLPVLTLMVLIVACGKMKGQPGGSQVGRFIDPVFVGADATTQAKVQLLCQMLAAKDSAFRTTYLNDYSKFNFSTSFTSCVGPEQTSSVVAKLRLGSGQLEYNVVSGSYFSTQTETATQGMISALCSRQADLTRPLKISEDTVVEYEFTSNVSSCASEINTECIVLRTAFRQDSGKFLVTMEDKFTIGSQPGPLRGMVKRHERFDLATCTGGKRINNVSVFTGVTN